MASDMRGSQYAEILISNYDTAERKNANRQMTFFDEMQENESED